MKFLLDQDVYRITADFLRDLGHDVVLAADLGLSRVHDSQLLAVAHEQGRILVTRDRDFGELVFLQGLQAGVLYLRIRPKTLKQSHQELKRVLELHSEESLLAAFVVIEPGRHRFRHLPQR